MAGAVHRRWAAQSRQLLPQRSPRQLPRLRSHIAPGTFSAPEPPSAASPVADAPYGRCGLSRGPPCASGARCQRLTPDSNCRALRPAGSPVLCTRASSEFSSLLHLPAQFRRLGRTAFRPVGVSLPPSGRLAGRAPVALPHRSFHPLPLSCRVRGRFAAGQTGGVFRPVGVVSSAVWPSGGVACPHATVSARKGPPSPTLVPRPGDGLPLRAVPASAFGVYWPFAAKGPSKLTRALAPLPRRPERRARGN